jgi:large-conductance mechanosensitive channel
LCLFACVIAVTPPFTQHSKFAMRTVLVALMVAVAISRAAGAFLRVARSQILRPLAGYVRLVPIWFNRAHAALSETHVCFACAETTAQVCPFITGSLQQHPIVTHEQWSRLDS